MGVCMCDIACKKDFTKSNLIWEELASVLWSLSYFMGLNLGPFLQPLEHSIIALNNPVLLNGEWLDFGCSNGHAKPNFQDPSTFTTTTNDIGLYLPHHWLLYLTGDEKWIGAQLYCLLVKRYLGYGESRGKNVWNARGESRRLWHVIERPLTARGSTASLSEINID